MKPMKAKTSWSIIVTRGVLFSLLWWILTDGAAPSWWIGVPAVSLAVIGSIALIPPASVVWYGFLRFVPFFFMRSLMGGVDVAWRAFHPSLPIDPDLVEYPLRLPLGLPRVFMANTVSLLPGTLNAELEQNVLKVHVLDRQGGFMAELDAVEQRVARMFDISLNVGGGGE